MFTVIENPNATGMPMSEALLGPPKKSKHHRESAPEKESSQPPLKVTPFQSFPSDE
jgi:peptidyl-prolyl cis-trans isomerase SDCCAG10